MDVTIPADLTALSDTELEQLLNDLVAAFDDLHDSGSTDLAALTELADAIDAVKAETNGRQEEAEKTAAKLAELAARVHPADEPEASDTPADEAEGEDENDDDTTPEEAIKPDLVTAGGQTMRPPARPSAGAIAKRAPRPAAPAKRPAAEVAIVASADVPGLVNGSRIGVEQVAEGFHARARGLNNGGPRAAVARIDTLSGTNKPVLTEDPNQNARLVRSLTAAYENDAMALVAAGGWCAPSQPLFDLFDITDAEGLLDLPSVGQTRGGVLVPSFYGFGDVSGALWTWTEANDIAADDTIVPSLRARASNVATLTVPTGHGVTGGQTIVVSGVDSGFDGTFVVTSVTGTTIVYANTGSDVASGAAPAAARVVNQTSPTPTKPCLRIPCPTWTECRPEAEGLCVTHGNLSDRAWPELTQYFINVVMAAHMHRLSAAKIAKIQTSAGASQATYDGPSDGAADLLGYLELQATDLRSQYRAGRNRTVEVILPEWVLPAIRANMAARAGVDMMNVTDALILTWFATRGIRPQFVSDYQPLYNLNGGAAEPAADWPTEVQALMFFAGAYLEVDGGSIDLGVVRDSTLNATNDFTAAWSEQFYCVVNVGPPARRVTITLDLDGVTACCPTA